MEKEKLNEIQKKDLERLRVQKEFEDGSTKGSIIIDDISGKTFIEFREISRTWFGNKDGSTFAAMVQLFLAEKYRQEVIKNSEKGGT